MLKQHGQPVEIADGVFWLRIGSVSGNVYFISAGSAWALVDAGLANRGEQIRRAAETLFGAGTAPVAILLTHVHPDHCGSARELARLWSCPVYTHPDELSLAVDRRLATVVRFANPLDRWLILPLLRTIPRRRLEAMLEKDSLAGVARSLPPDAAVPGLEGWTSISAPGHSPGHVVFFRAADRVLISGDAVVTVVLDSFWRSLPYALLPAKPRVSGPPWYTTWNQQQARTSIAALARLEPRVLASGHGVPLVGWSTAGLLRAYAERRALEVSVLPQGPRVQVRPGSTGRDLRQRRTMIARSTVRSTSRSDIQGRHRDWSQQRHRFRDGTSPGREERHRDSRLS